MLGLFTSIRSIKLICHKMNPFDNFNLAGKGVVGVTAPIASILATIPNELNPYLQTIALLAGITVSILSALSIIKKNLK
jgi:hypothetical protein